MTWLICSIVSGRMTTIASAFAASASSALAGVSSFSRHPAEAQRLPVVASHGRVDIERLIALRPDLVLAVVEFTELVRCEREAVVRGDRTAQRFAGWKREHREVLQMGHVRQRSKACASGPQ